MTSRNSGGNTDARNPNGTFANGNSGKPRGSRHKATQVAVSLLDDATGKLTSKAIDLALDGDTTALRLCLERVCPPRKDTPVSFTLPDISKATDAAGAAAGILHAVAAGELTPLEATSVMGLVDSYRRTLEVGEIELRIEALEAGDAKSH